MNRNDKSTWLMTAAAVLCLACGLLALNGLEVQALDETLGLGTQSEALKDAPKTYRADSRADIMLGAAGGVLN